MGKSLTSYKGILLTILVLASVTQVTVAQNTLDIFGYFSTRFEKTFDEPELENGKIVETSAPAEFTYPYLNIMFQQGIADHFKIYLNLNGANATNITVRNVWGEYSMNQNLNIRFGKVYRKFGLYNEILDAVPTYYGIEPPELFDKDHLMLTRETTLMIFGGFDLGPGTFNYSVTTDNGEGGPFESVIPVGWDLNYKLGQDLTVGTSGFMSGDKAISDVGVGDGSPTNGVLPWMANDKFSIFGGYIEGQIGSLTLQGEFWTSTHNAERNPDAVLTLLKEGNLFDSQKERFLIDKNGSTTDNANIRTKVDYDIVTWYFRAGYSFETSFGEIAPYLQWDYYSNPEQIKKKSLGGDNEAGASEDGKFNKSTLGIIFRPIQEVAIKLDQSFHFYKLNGEDVKYNEIRFDVSYMFGL